MHLFRSFFHFRLYSTSQISDIAVPHFFIMGMEYVGAVFVYGYPFRIFAIYITAQMGTLVDDQTFLAMLLGHTGKCSPEQACTNYQEIVFVLHTALFIR